MIAINPSWTYVVGGIICSSLAQIFLKKATLLEARETFWMLCIAGSALCYLTSFAAYYLALRQFAISRISPLMTVGVVMIVVAYGVWMGETVTIRQSLGIVFGVVSILLILS